MIIFKLKTMNKNELVEQMLKEKADINNIIDLNAYSAGLIDMYDMLNNKINTKQEKCIVCCNTLTDCEYTGGNCCDSCWHKF